uniref:Uncharacterized protein n=1 Tax=viral metagenome TaxID=1070528 RepID=A0A6C0E4T4_9ZZZZ
MNSNYDNETKNKVGDTFENKMSSLSSSIKSGIKSLSSSNDSSSNNGNNSSTSELIDSSSTNKIMGMDWKIFILIIVIFGLLGVNIFVYLAVGTQDVINAIKPITDAFVNFFKSIFKGNILNIFTNAIQGVYDLLFIAQGSIKGGVSAVDKLTDDQNDNNSLFSKSNNPATPVPSTQIYKQPTSLPQSVASNASIKTIYAQQPQPQPQPQTQKPPSTFKNIAAQNVANSIPLANTLNNASLDQALNTALIQDTSAPNNTPNTFNYTADDSMSNIQQSKSTSKSGWCFIGEDRGFRSCIQVNENEKCMSGDIFPSQEICINPNLRQ